MTSKSSFKIASHAIGEGEPVFLIAEAGVNHNGELDLALQLVDAAAKAGADAVKFQTFKAEEVTTGSGTMAGYQKRNSGKDESQIAMLRALELQEEFYAPLRKRCEERGIMFLSTPHGGFASVDFLAELKVPAFKFGSGDLNNLPLIAHAAKVDIPMIFGTGMATLAEVQEAVQTCYDAGNRDIVMLHCTTNYPCPLDEVDLRAMQTMMSELDCLVGYSDHTMGIQVPTMAVTLGAVVIEKHFTLSRDMQGPDHAASLEPDELAEMVRAVRDVSVIMGTPEKKPHASEADVTVIARKSVVSLREIKVGEAFTKDNLGIKRPGDGLAPRRYLDILGQKAKKDIDADSQLQEGDF